MSRVAIIGIGLHPFGRHPEKTAKQMGVHAARLALEDAGAAWSDVHIAFGGSRDGGNAANALNELGLTGIPFINVYNGCATGGSALFAAANAILSGSANMAMAIGFDKHVPGAFNSDPKNYGLEPWYAELGLKVTTQFFAMKLQRYMHLHDIPELTLSQVAEKAFQNGERTETAWRRKALSLDEIANSTMVSDPLRKFMFCSPAEGGAAILLCDEQTARKYTTTPLFLDACVFRTRRYGSFEVFSPCQAAQDVDPPSVDAGLAAFEEASISPQDVGVLQLQDTDVGAEIMHMAENGFCEHGEQPSLIESGETRIGGRLPINTDGGCLANGEPVGASGLRQVYEVCLQLRGLAEGRQIPSGPKVGYTHVYGAPGISAVNIVSV